MAIKKDDNLILPENSSEIILALTEKYGLSESDEVFADKIEKNEIPNSRKIAFLVRRVAEKKVNKENMALELQNRLGLAEDKASDLARELTGNFFSQETNQAPVVEKTTQQPEPTPSIIPQEPVKKSDSDVYREPVE